MKICAGGSPILLILGRYKVIMTATCTAISTFVPFISSIKQSHSGGSIVYTAVKREAKTMLFEK